jgi:rhodanese-related sulfurtransferase
MIKKLKNILKSLLRNKQMNLHGSEFKAQFEQDSNAVLLDVRTPAEYNGGHIPNSINLDIMSYNFRNEIEQLDKNKTYFVYCRSGNRSGQACMMMSDLGLKAYNLIGGIGAWPHN